MENCATSIQKCTTLEKQMYVTRYHVCFPGCAQAPPQNGNTLKMACVEYYISRNYSVMNFLFGIVNQSLVFSTKKNKISDFCIHRTIHAIVWIFPSS